MKNNSRNYIQGLAVLDKEIISLPSKPGIYKMLDSKDDVLYIGKAKNLKKRVSSYTKLKNQSKRILRMISETKTLEISTTLTEVEALLLESNLIKKNKPKYNILLRDDKSFPNILLSTNNSFPQIKKHRGKKNEKGFYFGPFASANSVNKAIDALQKGFMIRNCSDNIFNLRTRPCLQYQIKRCTAPCVGLVDKNEYNKQVIQVKNFLSGQSDKIKKDFADKMQTCSDKLDFENATLWRNKIRALASIQAFQNINVKELGDVDIISLYKKYNNIAIHISFMRSGSNFGDHTFFPAQAKELNSDEIISGFLSQFYESKIPPKEIILSHSPKENILMVEALSSIAGYKIKLTCPQKGIKKKLIDASLTNAELSLNRKIIEQDKTYKNFNELKTLFNLEKDIKRIEIYDNSHIQGKFAVGAMVVANTEGFDKSSYRKFNLEFNQKILGGNDFKMMRDVIKRRFKNISSESKRNNLPNLILIDGGKGHLNAVYQVLQDLQLEEIKVCAISKGVQRNAGKEKFHLINQNSFTLPTNSLIMFFLQKLRDEAHRFAISSHRAQRKKALTYNPIDEIEGIGNIKKQALLKYFGSAKEVSRAGIDNLKKVTGISQNIAERIYNFFQDN